MKNFFFLVLLAFILFSSGCGSDDDGITGPAFCNDQAFSTAVSDAVTNLNNAAMVYANDPTTANCNAYKAAATNYLDEVRRFEGCAGFGTRDDFRDAVRQAQESVDAITC